MGETGRVGVDAELDLAVPVDLVEPLRGDVEQRRNSLLTVADRDRDGNAQKVFGGGAGLRLGSAQRNALRSRPKKPPSSSR